MKRKIKLSVGILILIFLFFLGFFFGQKLKFEEKTQKEELEIKKSTSNSISQLKEKFEKENSSNKIFSFSETVNLNVPFFLQAPTGKWGGIFETTCEEASVLMVYYFLTQKPPPSPEELEKEILRIVEFEKERYHFHKDTSAAQTAKLIKDYFGLETQVFYDITLSDIKKFLNEGLPVIVPVKGRILNNPYYTPPGPLHHMIVIRGYNSEGFFTNDPGTKRGENFFYSFETIEKSLGDYNDEFKDKKAMIVVFPSK